MRKTSRAIDKYNEAKHFLGQMKEELTRYDEKIDNQSRDRFRYAVSAFASAARSVTFVLQAQYRSAHGDEFERWYLRAKQRLAENPAAGVLLNLRNVAQKEGNRLPLWCIEGVGPTGTSILVTYEVTAAAEDAIVSWGLQFSPADMPLFPIDPARGEPTEAEIKELIIREVAPRMGRHLTDEAFTSYKPIREWLVISDSKDEVAFGEFLKLCDGFVEVLRQLVLEARDRFDNSQQ